MKQLLSLIAVAGLTTAASAENRASIIQMGTGNVQSTFQSGQNTALVAQVGAENSANIVQTGDDNIAAVGQMGVGHERSVVQDGSRLGYGSIQASSAFSRSYTRTGGNAFTSTTAELDVGPATGTEPESEQVPEE